MRLTDYQVLATLADEGDRQVLLAVRGERRWLLKVYSDPALADYDEHLARRVAGDQTAAHEARFDDAGRTVLVRETFARLTGDQTLAALTTLAQRTAFIREIAKALAPVHARGVTYNDLSLEGLLVDEAGGIHLLDFAWAQREGEAPRRHGERFSPRQIPYVSPERTGKVAHAVGAPSDLYALGVILYRILCGRAPFVAASAAELISLHLAGQPMPPDEVDPAIPAGLAAITMRLLERARAPLPGRRRPDP